MPKINQEEYESKEAEVKKDREWAQKEIDRYLSYEGVNEARNALVFAKGVINQLDEPEVLAQGWIDDHKVARINNLRKMTTEDVVSVKDLQNILVPKQELPVVPNYVAKWISEHHEKFDLYPALKRLENNALSWKDVYEWYRKNTRKFVNAYLTRKYEVEERELTVKEVIEEHIELLKKQEVAVNLKPYYDLWEELKEYEELEEEPDAKKNNREEYEVLKGLDDIKKGLFFKSFFNK